MQQKSIVNQQQAQPQQQKKLKYIQQKPTQFQEIQE